MVMVPMMMVVMTVIVATTAVVVIVGVGGRSPRLERKGRAAGR